MEWPLVIRLVVHLLGQHNVIFNENEILVIVAEHATHQKTTLTNYFAYNAQNANGRNVVYVDFPIDHVWKIQEKVWLARQRGEKVVW
jgi:Tfp pilus assembly ATPase PilU